MTVYRERYAAVEITSDGKVVDYGVIDNETDRLQDGFDTLQSAKARADVKNRIDEHLMKLVK